MSLRQIHSPYLRFRLSLTKHGLTQFAATLRSSLEILLATAGPVALALLATSALPPVLAANLPALQALPLLLLHAVIMTLPAWLLRTHMLPSPALDLLRPLPVPARTRLQADALVAATVMSPLALAYAISLAILLWQQPAWMHPTSGVIATVFSCATTWLSVTLILSHRGAHPPPRPRRAQRTNALRYTQPHGHPLWRHMYWTPMWRGPSATGPRQAALLVSSCLSAAFWPHPTWIPAPVLGLTTSILLILLAHLGDQATRTQILRLRPITASWPINMARIEHQARAFTLIPSLLVCLVLATTNIKTHFAGRLYLALSLLAPVLLVALPPTSPRARVAWVAAAILILSAIGSEI